MLNGKDDKWINGILINLLAVHIGRQYPACIGIGEWWSKNGPIFTHSVYVEPSNDGMVRGILSGRTSRTIQFPIDLAAMNRIIKTVLIKFIEWLFYVFVVTYSGMKLSLVPNDLWIGNWYFVFLLIHFEQLFYIKEPLTLSCITEHDVEHFWSN